MKSFHDSIKMRNGLELQRAATLLRSANGNDPADALLWRDLLRIQPESRSLYESIAKRPDDFAALAANAGAPVVNLPKLAATTKSGVEDGLNSEQFSLEALAVVNHAMTTAYALAANGKADAARAWVGAVRKIGQPLAPSETNPSSLLRDAVMSLIIDLIKKEAQFVPKSALIEARIAIAQGRLDDAAAAVADMQLRENPMTLEFYTAYAAAARTAGRDMSELQKLLPTLHGQSLARLARNLLISPESKDTKIDYQKSGSNAVGSFLGSVLSAGTFNDNNARTYGFHSTPNSDGSIKVEYRGKTMSGPIVQEMTLLRAAEVVREAGKSHFQIIKRNDFEEVTTISSQFGTKRTLSGYKTEIDIRLLDEGESQPQALEAKAIIDALGSVYYTK
jgi:hypothetical protein